MLLDTLQEMDFISVLLSCLKIHYGISNHGANDFIELVNATG